MIICDNNFIQISDDLLKSPANIYNSIQCSSLLSIPHRVVVSGKPDKFILITSLHILFLLQH